MNDGHLRVLRVIAYVHSKIGVTNMFTIQQALQKSEISFQLCQDTAVTGLVAVYR